MMAKDSAKTPDPELRGPRQVEPDTLCLHRLELCEIELPLKYAFETSFGTTTKRRVLLVRVIDGSGESGWGECTAMELPLYNHESVDTAWTVIVGCIAPMLMSRPVTSAASVSASLSPIRGNRMAIAAVETAIWDLEAKLLKQPLWRHLGGTLSEINCGVSIGLQDSPEVLIKKVSREVEAGYQRIKLKIKPGKDVKFVAAVRQAFPDILLSVDANAAYNLQDDLDTLRQLDEYNLLMMEQPLAAGDLLDHSKLQKLISTPICLDESITSLRDAEQALELDACRIINIKLGRVGGHSQAVAIQEFAKSRSIPVWCGGMLETGVGRAHNIAMSTLDGFTLPGDISASSRYWEHDIVNPPVTVSTYGTIEPSSGAGIGCSLSIERIDSLTSRAETISL